MEIDQEAYDIALHLFMSGYPVKEIQDMLEKEFDKKVTAQTIYNWRRKGDWDNKRGNILAVREAKVKELVSNRLAEQAGKRFQIYGDVIDKAAEELPNLSFRSGLSAAQAIALAAEGQRKETNLGMRHDFIERVWAAIKEEYPEIDVDRVKNRLYLMAEAENKYD